VSINGDVETAIRLQLSTLGTTPIAWPNEDFSSEPPYLELNVLHNDTTRLTIDQFNRRPVIAQVTVNWALNSGTSQANDLADAIADHFPTDLRMPVTSGTLRVTKAPVAGQGFADKAAWRIPVSIYMETLTDH